MFKAYNDHYGHQAGDDALKLFCQTIQKVISRSTDYLFRLGGEEFALLFSVDFPIEKAVSFVESIREDIENLAITHTKSAHGVVTASFGMVIIYEALSVKLCSDVLYVHADRLLYDAKKDGRNRVAYEII